MRQYDLAASNIGWAAQEDETVYQLMRQLGYTALEIAPTRLFPKNPYDHLREASDFAQKMGEEYGLRIASLQSIWYGQTGSIFNRAQAEQLLAYTEKAFDFARACRCKNMVFGCPRSRAIPEGHTAAEAEVFFGRVAKLAMGKYVTFALEPNPPIYGTNYLNGTVETMQLVEKFRCIGIGVNLDMGAMIYNGERIEEIAPYMRYVSHIHISEPNLAPIQPRPIHAELAALLKKIGYRNAVSVEMKCADPDTLRQSLAYVAEVFA